MSASIKAGLNNDMHLMTDGVTRAYIDSDGNVGIGTSSPGALLSIPAGGSSTPRFAIESATDNNNFTITQYEDGNGTYTMLGQNVKLNSGGNNTVSDAAHKTAGIQFDARNNGTLTFVTGAANTATENMQISSAGHVTTPSQPSFLAGMSALQSLVHATVTKVQFNQSVEQTGSNFSTSNYRFTCPVAGRYLFNWHVYVYSVKNMESKLYKNGSSLIRIASPVAYQDENPHGGGGSVILEANANDYFEIYAAGYHSSGGGSSVYPGSGAERPSFFSGMLIG